MYTYKDRVRVMIVTNGFRIEGDFHVLAGSRLTDALNSKAKEYFAITDAKVYGMDGGAELYAPPYVAVNRASIACIFPLE
ncbi:MAG: hypothetical protein Q7W16_03800 [Coriobacteriia bacterium]|nr:hypothetical protein [Coriobacteriia bacterium]